MRLLVSGTTRTVSRLASRWPDRLGMLLTPSTGNSVRSISAIGLPWAANNGAYSGFDADRFRRFLRRVTGVPGCLFLVAPDVVSDARATLALLGEWAIECRATGHPLALVGQDGAENTDIPWRDIDAWFIGGSTRWKLSQASADLAYHAKGLGKHVHMGRVNSLRRIRAAYDMWCDSIDGSSASMFGDHYIHKYCLWLDMICRQKTFV